MRFQGEGKGGMYTRNVLVCSVVLAGNQGFEGPHPHSLQSGVGHGAE